MKLIEVFADIWCPFAHVGLRAVVARRVQLGCEDVVIGVRAWPLELVNGEPLDPTITAEHVEELRRQVAPDLFARFDRDNFPRTSLPALALASAGYRQSDRVGETVSLALRDALFEEGRDIADPDVLARIADAHGVGPPGVADEEAVRAQWHEGEARGVEGSPHFFCGDVDAFCPSLRIAKDDHGQLHVRRDREALDTFLATCFEGVSGR